MKKRLMIICLVSAFILVGCSGKGIDTSPAAVSNTTSTTLSGESDSKALSNISDQSADSLKRADVYSEFKPVEEKSVPQLTTQQKSRLDLKLNSALKSIDNALNSLQDAPDIDLDSLEK